LRNPCSGYGNKSKGENSTDERAKSQLSNRLPKGQKSDTLLG
jgi:hypothetical protein